MIRDAEYFKLKIGSIEGTGDAGDYLITLIKDKNVPKPKAAPTPIPEPDRASVEEVVATGKNSSEAAAPDTGDSKDEKSIDTKDEEAEKAS